MAIRVYGYILTNRTTPKLNYWFISLKMQDCELFKQRFIVGMQHQLEQTIASTIKGQNTQPLHLTHHNLHSLALAKKSEEYSRAIHSADFFWIDGMPVIWMLRLLGYPLTQDWRLTFLDWQQSFWSMADREGFSVFLVGGSVGVADLTAKKLNVKYPNIKFATHHGYFDLVDTSPETLSVCEQINHFNTDILMVGLGMPLQELWLHEIKDRVSSKVIMPIGGYFDYIAGTTTTPPRWMGRVGLEWLFRLISSPKRLAFRYLIEPWPVLSSFVVELLKRYIFSTKNE